MASSKMSVAITQLAMGRVKLDILYMPYLYSIRAVRILIKIKSVMCHSREWCPLL